MKEWWRGGVIYQIYPRSYQDSNNDGIGDLAGITSRLEYISELGVDGIWISPIFTSPMKDMGYDVSDYRDIDPLFGDLKDFDRLVERAHSLGLKVMIDQVLSHSSDQHPFFQASKQDKHNDKADWYVWVDPLPDGAPPNNWLSIFEGVAWEWESRRKQYYQHNFLVSQPDFNFHNPEVREWLKENVKFWLDRGVDGFRLDTVNYYFHDPQLRDNPPRNYDKDNPPVNPYYMQDHVYSISQPENVDFVEELRELLDQYGKTAMIGEISNLDLMAEYTAGDNRLHLAYSFELLGPVFSASHIRKTVEHFFNIAPQGIPCWSFSNHDVIRHVSRWAAHGSSPEALAKQTAALLLSLEGSICLFQGEELGQLETEMEFSELTDPVGIRFWPENKGRDGCRTPMSWDSSLENAGFSEVDPWLPVKNPQLERAVEQQKNKDSVLSFYREMLKFRKNSSALSGGRTVFYDSDEPVLSFSRKSDDQKVVCVFNLSKEEVSLQIEGLKDINNHPFLDAKADGEVLSLGPNGFCFFFGDLDKDIVIQ
mgnify:FL=1